MTDRLSRKQKSVLDALTVHEQTGLTPAELGKRIGSSKEGAATTASSLVRRGFVVRERAEHLVYKITPVGRTYSPAWQIVQAVQAQRDAELDEDHGPGCDGPLNCTCEPALEHAGGAS